MSTLKNNHIVQKRNVLNEIRANNMTLQELRFFSIYLAKINKDKPEETRLVRFPLSEFQAIMGLGRIDIEYMKNVTNSLLCKVVNVPNESGGYIGFQLFKECVVDKDKNGEWYVEIDAHDRALPLMFEFKNKYFTYQLWNALRLRSSNQLRMYEILKQYETAGTRVLELQKLRSLLGIDKKEYPRFGDFKKWVIDACQQALEENTDIKFTYESYGKRGKGGKIQQLKFVISRNDGYRDPLSLDEFIDYRKFADILAHDEDEDAIAADDDEYDREEDKGSSIYQDALSFMADACGNEFSPPEMQVLYNLLIKIVPYRHGKGWQLEMYDYLKRKYDELRWRDSRTQIKSRIGYLKKIIEADLELK